MKPIYMQQNVCVLHAASECIYVEYESIGGALFLHGNIV